ncbi:GntR family transcriptional regulator [Mameliella sediminis]|uniref:GntR family transcriptional regulator n=1 Tax=Mameliella sediminis TaxID=2836866 RepID=UPI001C469474|nr:GntR family transcriptional regulator [Mameliella sediminis]MBV7396443.1 GntR family transcriptional regulator [Mameliella sediminis]
MTKQTPPLDADTESVATAKRGTLSGRAYDAISTMIEQRQLASGNVIVEQQLADQLGISRTPLRQALQRLEAEGVLVKSANRSFQVRKVELREYLQSLKVRELLESEAASLCVDRVNPEAIQTARANLHAVKSRKPYDMLAHWRSDDEVHGLFIENCGNQVMTDMMHALRASTKMFEIDRLSERLEPDSRQHEMILDALDSRDAKAAKKAVAAHIRSLFQFAIETVS